jgi:hypothetical protein
VRIGCMGLEIHLIGSRAEREATMARLAEKLS